MTNKRNAHMHKYYNHLNWHIYANKYLESKIFYQRYIHINKLYRIFLIIKNSQEKLYTIIWTQIVWLCYNSLYAQKANINDNTSI